jgi:hypothetical protein
MSDDLATAWWHTLAPEARQAWIIHITGWTMGKVIDAAYAHATNADPPLSTEIPPELGITTG